MERDNLTGQLTLTTADGPTGRFMTDVDYLIGKAAHERRPCVSTMNHNTPQAGRMHSIMYHALIDTMKGWIKLIGSKAGGELDGDEPPKCIYFFGVRLTPDDSVPPDRINFYWKEEDAATRQPCVIIKAWPDAT